MPVNIHTADTAFNYLSVMEVPHVSEALPFARSPLHDTPSMVLLMLGLIAVALCYHTGYKYIENFFHYMFSTRRRENLFEDHTVNETSILAALIANTCIVEGFIIYFAVQLLMPDKAASLQGSLLCDGSRVLCNTMAGLQGVRIHFQRQGRDPIVA